MHRKLLIGSAILNVLLISALAYGFVLVTSALKSFHQIGYDRWSSQFKVIQAPEHPIVFLGDSLTEFCHWSELMTNQLVLNRGIGGDTLQDIFNRVGHIYELTPRKLFLMAGVNDLNNGIPTEVTKSNVVALFDGVASKLPKTEIFIQSILPINKQFRFGRAKNPDIVALNGFLRSQAEKRGFHYIDLHPNFTDGDGSLRSELSNDGIHLLGDGYQIWRDKVAIFVNR